MVRLTSWTPYVVFLAVLAAANHVFAMIVAAFLALAHFDGYMRGTLRERFRQIGFVPPKESTMAAEVINIPLTSDDLYLMRLEPSNETGVFRYVTDELGVWVVVECHVDRGVTAVEEYREMPGGGVQLQAKAPGTFNTRLAGQAERITREQFEQWEGMSLYDRVALQIVWADDALRFDEEMLQRALQRPYPEGAGTRYNYSVLNNIAAILVEGQGRLVGLREAQAALPRTEE